MSIKASQPILLIRILTYFSPLFGEAGYVHAHQCAVWYSGEFQESDL